MFARDTLFSLECSHDAWRRFILYWLKLKDNKGKLKADLIFCDWVTKKNMLRSGGNYGFDDTNISFNLDTSAKLCRNHWKPST